MTEQSASGQRVLVTAGAAGIGRAIVEALLAAGARVHLCDVDESALAEIAAAHPALSTSRADVADEADVDRLFADLGRSLGGLDVLVNNAGIAGPTAPIEEIDPADWRRCLEVDLTGQFLCARRAVPLLKAAGGGAIVNMSSAAGRLGYAFRTPYAAAKWGVIGLTQSLAKELGPHNISVNAILPGIVQGPPDRAGDRCPRRAAGALLRRDGAAISGQGLAAPDGDRAGGGGHGGLPGLAHGPCRLRPVAGRLRQCRDHLTWP